MKTVSKHLGRIILGVFLLLLIWMISLLLAEFFIPSHLESSQAPEITILFRFILICLIHVLLLYLTIRYSTWSGIKLTLVIFLLIFMIQYFMSMIEAIWFNDSLDMPLSGIKSILLSGFLLSLFFSPLMVWIGGGYSPKKDSQGHSWDEYLTKDLIWKIPLLILIIYPALYFLAGYFIAWQSESVRIFYTGSAEMEKFSEMMIENVKSGLYGFQILRGLMWVGIAIPVYIMLKGSFWMKGILIGLLFALLMNAQHLLPNPYFPSEVSKIHFIETATSNFVWGFLIVLIFHGMTPQKNNGFNDDNGRSSGLS